MRFRQPGISAHGRDGSRPNRSRFWTVGAFLAPQKAPRRWSPNSRNRMVTGWSPTEEIAQSRGNSMIARCETRHPSWGRRTLEEDIGIAPRLLQVRDFYPGRLRCSIAICEDFARVQPYHAAMRALAVTHLFIPIMNPARTGTSDWLKRYGISLAQEGHTVSVVANSGVLVRAGASPADLLDSKHYCELIGPEQKRYPVAKISESIDKSIGCVNAIVLEMRPDPHS
jgi:hypothetical protein